jgi:acyl-CoA dehydrogenase
MTESLETFRREVRAWLEANCPATMRTAPARRHRRRLGRPSRHLAARRSEGVARAHGLARVDRPDVPKEYGGGGLSPAEARVLEQELRSLGCRIALRSFGLWMLGPVLLQFGNEAQKKEHLPRIVRGEVRWCQGYSEPAAGSDLASLQTKAVLSDDGTTYTVNGQKVWTSHADKADWMFCLVRTDPTAKKQEGISFLLIDMQSPGSRSGRSSSSAARRPSARASSMT